MMLDTATQAIIIVLTNSNPMDVNAFAAVLLNVVTSHTNITAVEEEFINHSDFQLHPNPSPNQLTLSNLPAGFSGTVAIYNAMGQLIFSEKKNDSQFSIQIGQLNTGIYFVQVKTDKGEIITKKFIKE